MNSLPDIIVPAKSRMPIDQMEMGLDLLRVVHAALQDHSFIDSGVLTALSGTMFTAFEMLEPVRDVLNRANRDEPPSQPAPGNLLEVIAQYREGDAAFHGWEARGYPNEEAAIAATYGPPALKLENWDRPLESLAEVREALRLAFNPDDAIISDMVKEPLRAALIYLEKITDWNDIGPEGDAA
ncbi:hypothetical protein [Ochrobactrum sp. AP1BH01-1]|uniref:hypothetical protein n=1 Tax=Ochrobactrum sp. AP1BH01-1 TaxID=2823874 RepID=UPI001B37C1CD|nr:hypothetical protein [Ochrobactrum sp. AP1BH01-1]MBQ0707872.1 hypothetical protein [Ochrobactrum sp. AP1BH01-1]